jgi:hypothetical protein
MKLITRLYQALGSAASPAGYVVPCVRFNRFVRLYIVASSTAATLGMSGWLDLAQPGLTPGKKRQALLGALTLKLTASRPHGTFRFQQSRYRAALRCSAKLGASCLVRVPHFLGPFALSLSLRLPPSALILCGGRGAQGLRWLLLWGSLVGLFFPSSCDLPKVPRGLASSSPLTKSSTTRPPRLGKHLKRA